MPILRTGANAYAVRVVPARHAGGAANTAGYNFGPYNWRSSSGVQDPAALTEFRPVEVAADVPQDVTGILFVSAPTFFTGAVTPGEVALTGTLFTSAPTFFAGVVTSGTPLTGTLYVNTPTFFAGVVTPGTVTLTGTLYTITPTFPTGVVSAGAGDQTLTGSLFTSTPTFSTGVLTATYALTGTLHVHAPTFFQGAIRRAVPTGLVLNEIGVLGHSNVGTFISYYRSISARDLLTSINHGSYDVESWGDPLHADYTAAWAKLDDDEPVGGYRAFWVMLGFRSFHTNQAQNEAWAVHIAGRLLTDFPTIEYLWWSPMNTYFTTNPGDGDAEDLVALDPWDTNPSSLTTWRVVLDDVDSEMSWNTTKYAIAEGYADDYGPWINLIEAITDTDDRHPSEAPGDPVPNGQTHGGDILLAFFEDNALGLAGNLLTVTPTFFTGIVTAGAVALTGTLFTSPPTFQTGVLSAVYALTGTLFTVTPTFFAGTLSSTYALTGTLYTQAPTFFTGVVTPGAVALTGTLFVSAPTFFTGNIGGVAVAHDAVSESHTGTTGSASEASFTWQHDPTGTPRGVLVFVFQNGGATDFVTGVTYAGVALTAVPGGLAVDTVDEVAWAKAYFLGSSVPADDPATVVVTRTNNANIMWAAAITVTAQGDTAVTGIVLLQEDGTLAEQSVDDGSPGFDSVRYAGINSGLPAVPAAGAASTLIADIDYGARVVAVVRETVAGQGARSVGFSSGTTDDRAAVHLAVRQVVTVTLTGTTFVNPPTFFTGDVTAGTVSLTGTLFVSSPTFGTGTVTAGAVDLTGILYVNTPTFPAGTVTGEVTLTGTLYQNSPTFFAGILAPAGGLFGTLYLNPPLFFTGTVTVAAPSFWVRNPAGYTPAPVSHVKAPVAYVAVGAGGPSPWGVELSGDRFEVVPLFPVGSVT